MGFDFVLWDVYVCVCVFLCFFLILFVYLFALFDSLFSKETEKKGVELCGRGGREEDLEEDEGEVTVTRIYCGKNKLIFNKKLINKHLKW